MQTRSEVRIVRTHYGKTLCEPERIIKRKFSLNILRNRNKFNRMQTTFTMTNHMPLSGLWKKVILAKISTYHR